MTSRTGQQIITIDILPNISRINKHNQEMKIGQLIEYNVKNISLRNLSQNAVGKLVPVPFIKYKN